MDRQRYISVPRDQNAMEAYDLGEDTHDQMIEWAVTENEFNRMYSIGIFSALNDECDVLIDDYESEIIQCEKLESAKLILLSKFGEKELGEVKKLVEMIEEALQKNTLVAFDF